MPRKVKQTAVSEEQNIALAFSELCKDKALPVDVVVDAMSEALKKAYFRATKDYTDTILEVNIDLNTGKIEMFKIKNVVEEIKDDVFETDPEEAFEETGVQYNIGDVVKTPIDISSFKRMAAMQVKSVFKQKLREAEKQQVVKNFSNRVGDILTGVVESKHCIIKLDNHTNAYLNKNHMLPGDNFIKGQNVKVYVEEVDKTATGAPVIVSRTNPRFIVRLMEMEISDIANGTVEIKGVARQPGSRTKVSVYSKDPNVDPSGACIGPHGMTISHVLSYINNEKIDVVNYSDNPLLYVADALKPAIVTGMQMIDENTKSCRAIVNNDQYSLAIGKEAQNVNLAVRLTGWKIDIKKEEEAVEQGYEYVNVEDLKIIENAKRIRTAKLDNENKSVPIVEEKKVNETIEPEIETTPTIDNNIIETVVEPTTIPVTPTEPKVKPTTNKSLNAFSELEAALNSSSNNEDKQTPSRRKPAKKQVEKPAEDEPKVEVKKQVSPALPIYTEEELKSIQAEQEQEEAEEASKYDEDIDYDEFDDYYDDED